MRRARTHTPIAKMPRDKPLETAGEVRRQRDVTQRLLMELAEQMHEAVALLRDYARTYPNNSGRTTRFLKRLEKAGLGGPVAPS